MSDGILVFAEHRDGNIVRPTWEAIAAGQQMAQSLGLRVSAGVLAGYPDNLAEELATAELDQVLAVGSPLLAEYTADAFVQALAQLIRHEQPRFVVFSHTYQVRDFVPKLAAALDRGFISDCLSCGNTESGLTFVRQVFQGKLNANVEFAGDPPYLVSFQAGAYREDSVKGGTSAATISNITANLEAAKVRTRPGERFREAKQAVDLSQAQVIVAVGRGIKAPENLELAKKLAAALGGEIGASRPICDSGWVPMDRQIGSSGQTVAPKLYVALGISGAIQHQVGMKNSRTILAINKDREAPIFELATYGVVGDLFELVPPLIEEIDKIKPG
jgi:electron transfer flavoprotein alpha subunit